MEVFLVSNGLEIHASTDEQEATILAVAAGSSSREVLEDWLEGHVRALSRPD